MRLFLNLLFLLIIFCSVNISYARMSNKGSGELELYEYNDIKGFDRISIMGQAEVYIMQGDSDKVEMSIDKNLEKYVKLTTKGTTLNIHFTKKIFPTELKIYLTMKEFHGIKTRGDIDVFADKKISSDFILFRLDGAGKIQFKNIAVEQVKTDMQGFGKISLNGTANKSTIVLSGAGDINMKELKADDVKVQINGSGDAKVHSNQKLEVTINGSGDVVYYGNPKDVTTIVNGIGEIKKR